MNRILLYLKNYRLKAVMAPIFKCLEAIFELLVPMAVASMIDIGIGRGDTAYILKMGAVLLLLATVGFISSLTAQWFSARAAAIAATSMRYDLLQHIFGLSYADIDSCGTERLITSMTSDINQVQNGINMFLRLFMRSPFIVFGAAVMAFSIDKKMSLIFVLTIFVLSIIVFGILLGTVPLYKKVQSRQDDITGLSKEQISGAQVIRAFNQEENNKEEFRTHNRLLTDIQIYAAKISSFMNPATMLILNAALVLLIWKGAVNIESGSLTKGSLVALINYMGQILTELIKFANLIILISKAVASDRRIEEMFAFKGTGRNKKINQQCEDSKTLLEFKKVSFSYPNSQEPALSDISFRINKGEYIGIIGGTGSGKSTLAKLIAGLYSASQGEIYFNICESSDTDYLLRKNTTYVPQKPVIFEGNILENMLMGNYSENEYNEELIQSALRISQAEEFVNGFEDGVMHHTEQGGRNLSGGQKQRLCIARGICMDRPVLILDDPASALDFATERALRRELRTYKEEKGATVIVISQRAAMVRNADKIIVLNDGYAEAVGTHEELFERNETYHEICLTQEKSGEVSL